MALTNCSECGARIAENARTCPNCLHDRRSAETYRFFLYIAVLAFIVYVIYKVFDGN
jgi:predicted amidophosphoribosyltransferase